MINFDLEVFKSISERVFNCDSPSGYSKNIIRLLTSYLDEYNLGVMDKKERFK